MTTPTYGYKWFIGPSNGYRLNGNKHLKAREETVLPNSMNRKNIKLRLEFKIYPNCIEDNNKHVAKMRVKLTAKNAPLDTHYCIAIVEISLHDEDGTEIPLPSQNEHKLTSCMDYIQFFTTLGSQERIERYAKKNLDISLKVELQFRRICFEDRDGHVYVK